MATLIEELWRCKSANEGRQNNCPPTGTNMQPVKGEFRTLERDEEERDSEGDVPPGSSFNTFADPPRLRVEALNEVF